MIIKINNNVNLFPIILHALWIIYVEYFFFFKIDTFAKQTPCGAGYMMIGIPMVSIIFLFLALLTVSIINLIVEKKYYTDYKFILFPFTIMIGILILKIFF